MVIKLNRLLLLGFLFLVGGKLTPAETYNGVDNVDNVAWSSSSWSWPSWSSTWTSSWSWWYNNYYEELEECPDGVFAVDQYDSYGDGWNGWAFTLYDTAGNAIQEVSFNNWWGSSQSTCLNATSDACFVFAPSLDGYYANEISWEICDTTGYYLTEMTFCLDSDMNCHSVSTAEYDDLLDLDHFYYWDSTVSTWWEPPEVCDGPFDMHLFDDYGDGWNGWVFGLFTAAGEEIQTDVTLSYNEGDGSYINECLNVSASECYFFSPIQAGGWASEVSWEICGQTGYYNTEISFCVNSDFSCYAVSTVTVDTDDLEQYYDSSWSSWSWTWGSWSSWSSWWMEDFDCQHTFGGYCYAVSSWTATQSMAQDVCEENDATLASILSQEENAFLTELVDGVGTVSWGAWIGFMDDMTEDNWYWEDGSTVSYTNWASGEPNDLGIEDCAMIYDDGTWNDQGCNTWLHYICKWPQEGLMCVGDDDCPAGQSCICEQRKLEATENKAKKMKGWRKLFFGNVEECYCM
mmetsp:Transcript_20498/g.27021  ORF Transcript_20498/g.27021 Transcript_20498/m.27021 type:complete len:517 (+) Transcript_20498:262-1812(+)